MPHIIVKLWKGKSEAQKKKLADELVKAAMLVTGSDEDSFSVGIEDFEPSDWNEKVYKPDIAGQSDKLYRKPGYKMD